MRLPVTPQLNTKDGTANRNARLTNMLKESSKAGDKAVIRPGLVASDSYSGVGSGLIPFDGRLLVIYDDTVYDTELVDSLPWPLDALPWDAGTTYYYGDVVLCGGVIKFSMADGNIGNACNAAGSQYWAYSAPLTNQNTWNESTTYDLGDSILVEGVTYYNNLPNNLGNSPTGVNTSWYWGTTPLGIYRWSYNSVLYGSPDAPGVMQFSNYQTAYPDCSHANMAGQWYIAYDGAVQHESTDQWSPWASIGSGSCMSFVVLHAKFGANMQRVSV